MEETMLLNATLCGLVFSLKVLREADQGCLTL